MKTALEKQRRIKQDIDSLQHRIAGDQAHMQRLQKEAANLEDWISKWYELAGRPIPPTASERMMTLLALPDQRRPKNPDREFVAQKVLEIIRDRGEPMSRTELFKALKEQNVNIRGKDPEMVLSTMLWRSKDLIRRLVPFGYWPTNEPYYPYEKLNNDIINALESSDDE